jgi:flagellar biosynthetic protein FliS
MMSHSEIASQYREISARGSHPVGLVVRLYDAILEDFRRAMNAAAAGDIEGRTSSLNHALKIIAELQNVLDHERGKEVARRLSGFYDVTRMLIVEANLHSSIPRIQRLVDLYLPLYHAWRKVEQDAYAGKLQSDDNFNNPEQPTTSQMVPASEASGNTDLDAPHIQWNA